MAIDDEPLEPPLYRSRRAIEAMIEVLKTTVIRLHAEASTLRKREARELREVADDMDDYAEYLKERLNQPRFRDRT